MPLKVAAISILAILVFIAFPASASPRNDEPAINLMLSTLPAGKDPQRYPGYVEPKYKEFDVRSLYVQMRDGVRIAIDVVLPKNLPAGEKIPAIMTMTRYWRSRQGGQLAAWFAGHGYAQVLVDARGTGASFGVWRAPFSQDEVKDYGEVVNWIVSQPWCNGKVGAIGNSYEGNTALWLTVTMNPAVKAVIPRHFEFDEYNETPYPGGVLTDWMVQAWNDGNHRLDTNLGVKLVDGDENGHLYSEATEHRAENVNVYAAALKTVSRDDRNFGATLDDISLHSYIAQIEKSQAAINSWGGWFDASTADAVIKTFVSLTNFERAVVGPWNHGGGQNASPYQTAASPRVMQGYEWVRFFDHYLRGIDTHLDSERLFYYYTLGAEKWNVTRTWPVPGTTMKRWYLDEGNTLSAAAGHPGEDKYTVDFNATTGEKNRWHTQVGGKQVVYPDRALEDKKLLTYTSAPLTVDTEITGHAIIDLFVKSTHTDGAFFVYLEEVDESGKVTYLTEGQLRALHRKISDARPPYKLFVPYHSFKQKDTEPLVPGELAELKFGLEPISVLIRKGHRLRIALAGHDQSTFARIPATGIPTITISRKKPHMSWIDLPVVAQK